QAQRLVRIVNELLDVSRITAGRLDLHPEEVDVTKVIGSVLDRFEHECDAAGCSVSLAVISPTSGWFDPFRLDQITANLVSNAIKYGLGNPIEVTVGAKDGTARIEIKDQGIG